jgi:hypothetical protein
MFAVAVLLPVTGLAQVVSPARVASPIRSQTKLGRVAPASASPIGESKTDYYVRRAAYRVAEQPVSRSAARAVSDPPASIESRGDELARTSLQPRDLASVRARGWEPLQFVDTQTELRARSSDERLRRETIESEPEYRTRREPADDRPRLIDPPASSAESRGQPRQPVQQYWVPTRSYDDRCGPVTSSQRRYVYSPPTRYAADEFSGQIQIPGPEFTAPLPRRDVGPPPGFFYRPLLPLSTVPRDYFVAQGIYGQPKVYVPRQPVRNFLRYLTP